MAELRRQYQPPPAAPARPPGPRRLRPSAAVERTCASTNAGKQAAQYHSSRELAATRRGDGRPPARPAAAAAAAAGGAAMVAPSSGQGSGGLRSPDRFALSAEGVAQLKPEKAERKTPESWESSYTALDCIFYLFRFNLSRQAQRSTTGAKHNPK